MIYTKLTRKAMQTAFQAHKEQVDKCGVPYIFHPFHVAEQMKDEISVCVALLHDVVEDSDLTMDDLRANGFPETVLEALNLLTHKDGEPYLEYVNRIKDNPVAMAVKLADLEHNMDMSRMDNPGARDYERLRKYKQAVRLLKGFTQIEVFRSVDAQFTPCCGIRVPADYLFCPYCGKSLSDTDKTQMIWDTQISRQSCPECQKAMPSDERYCGYCGTKLR